MSEEILLSTAYFPPAHYFKLINEAGNILIEYEENYPRQTYRNRCRILTASGVMNLSVPVTKKGQEKMLTRDVLVDYSKRWQQVHLRALISAYNRSPFFQYYFEYFEPVILKNHKFLIDLNNDLLQKCLGILNIKKNISHTSFFIPDTGEENDFRGLIRPGINSGFQQKPYIQVFSNNDFIPDLSILDLIFNTGRDAINYLS